MLMDQNLMIKAVSKKYVIPKDVKGPETLVNAMKCFLQGEVGTFGAYVSTKNALVYRSLSTVDGYTQDVLCFRLIQDMQVHYLGNSSRLRVEGTNMAFGKRSRNWGTSPSQNLMERMGMPLLPFQSFTEAGLKVSSTNILEQAGAESVTVKVEKYKKGKYSFENETRHFTGASLFQIGPKTFLFDIDREEIKHGIFNPFIVEIPKKISSISEAYDALVPIEVRTAIIEGKTVLRQGEHFFIKVAEQNAYAPTKEANRWNENKLELVLGRLSAQGNRDHVCSLFNRETNYVSGEVVHQGREHKNLELNGWFKAVPNTAVRSFTISGDID